MIRTDRRSDCPVSFALEAFGDAWSLLVVRDLVFKGPRTYSEFAASGERISTNVLAARLRSLDEAGIVRRGGEGRAARYALTEKGADLVPVLVEMIAWSGRHDPETASPPEFLQRAANDREGLVRDLRARVRSEHGLSLPPEPAP